MLAGDVHEAIAERLRAVGQRYTTGRRELVDVLGAATGPLTIAAILRLRSDLAQSSVYRNLATLEDAGVVRRVPGAADTHYELAEDLDEHHHHLLCTSCGEVEDFVMPTALERALHKAVDAAADQADFAATGHRVELVGTCATCRAAAK
jgi:Fe2+ or Zn2+ uptake regulation protein